LSKQRFNFLFFEIVGNLLNILTKAERSAFRRILISTTFGVGLEVLSVVMILPIMAHLTGSPMSINIPFLNSIPNYTRQFGPEWSLFADILFLIVVVLIKNSYLTWLAYKQSGFGHKVQSRISKQLFENYLYQPFQYHANINSSILIRNCVHEANQFNQFVILPSFTIISEAFLIVGIAILLVVLQPYYTLVNGILLGFSFVMFNRLTGKKIIGWGSEKLKSEARRIQLIQQSLGAIKEVKLRQSEKHFTEAYNHYNNESARASHSYNALQQVPRLFLEVLIYVGLLLLVVLTIATHSSISELVTALGLFAAAVYKALPSANKVSTSYQSMKMSTPSLSNFITELNLPREQRSTLEEQHDRIKFASEIRLNEISFSYSRENPILHDVSLVIKKGSCIGLVGESGSGKSTLLNIVLGLIKPQKGFISVDNIEIAQNMSGWQQNIGYVAQNIYLIDDTLRRNIAFGAPDNLIDDAAIYAALDKAHLIEFVKSLSSGLDTLTGERGVRLSGGQIQRIGIARALYHNPEILVFDEATSALDNSTEASIMEAIESLYRSKTIIIVAHRLSTIQKCDFIYRIENGAVVREGH
jgi:ABC-type multidrug transport system fused ATPase/permease subunit